MTQPDLTQITLDVNTETVTFLAQQGLIEHAEDVERARITSKGLNILAVCTAFLSKEIEGNVEAPTWQFEGLQVFLAVILEKLSQRQHGGALPHDGESQHG